MAKLLTEMPKIHRVGGGRRGSKYPLDEWLDGQMRELVDGEDFNNEELGAVKRESLQNSLHNQAARRGLKIKIVNTEDGFALVAFQAEDESTNGASEAEVEEALEEVVDPLEE